MHQARPSFLKSLLHSWHQSIDLFEPKELSLVLLASLNATVRSLGILFKNGLWLLFVWAGYVDLRIDGSGLFCHFWDYTQPLYFSLGWEPRVYLLTLMLAAFVIILSARSSLEAKTLGYFMRGMKRLPFVALLFFVIPQIYAIPIFWLTTFFLCDSPVSFYSFVRSVRNGILLSFLYAPYLLCLGALHGILFHMHRLAWDLTPLEEHYFVPYATKYATSVLLYLLFVVMLHTFYVRVVQANTTSSLFKKSV